jgi:hypothetical protein
VIEFDGTNIWIINEFDSTLTKLSLTGDNLGTFTVGNNPMGMAFDGTNNVWITNNEDSTVTKLSLAGSVMGTYTTGVNPYGIAFDGTNMWICN